MQVLLSLKFVQFVIAISHVEQNEGTSLGKWVGLWIETQFHTTRNELRRGRIEKSVEGKMRKSKASMFR